MLAEELHMKDLILGRDLSYDVRRGATRHSVFLVHALMSPDANHTHDINGSVTRPSYGHPSPGILPARRTGYKCMS